MYNRTKPCNDLPLLPPKPIEAIKFRIEQLGIKQSDLAEAMGGKNFIKN